MIYDVFAKMEELFKGKYQLAASVLLGIEPEELQLSYGRSPNRGRLRVHTDRVRDISDFSLEEFLGNDQVLISADVWVAKQHRNKGIGRLLNKLKVEAAAASGATAICCIVNNTNTAELQVLECAGWQHGFDVSPTAAMWYKRLDQ